MALEGEMQTLLIPLYAKSVISGKGGFSDPMARRIVSSADFDFASLRIARKTQIMMVMRAMQLDQYTERFVRENPGCTVIHLGCGLDARCLRVSAGAGEWYDLDLPPVIDCRRQYYTESEHYHMIACSATDRSWASLIEGAARPVLIVAEGLLMYLQEAEVRGLFRLLSSYFPGSIFVFDAFSSFAVEQMARHPSLRRSGATVRWGIDDLAQPESYSAGVKHLQTIHLSDFQDPKMFGLAFSLALKAASAFEKAKNAHRILIYRMGEEKGAEASEEKCSATE